MIRVLRVISEFLQKSAHLAADSNDDAPQKKTPPSAEPDLALGLRMARDQWPKNSHNKMITGIGTPRSQSKIPRPMVSSNFFQSKGKRRGAGRVPATGTESLTVSGVPHGTMFKNFQGFSEAAP